MVGLVALALLVYGRTGERAGDRGTVHRRQVPPAFLAPALTARLDQLGLRRVLPAALRRRGAGLRGPRRVRADPLLSRVLALALVDGTLALTGRGLTRGAVGRVLEPRGLLREGNALFNVSFAVAGRRRPALGGVLVGGSALARRCCSTRRRSVIAALAARDARAACPGAHREPSAARRVRDGLGHVRAPPEVRLLLGGAGARAGVLHARVPIEVVYAKETLEHRRRRLRRAAARLGRRDRRRVAGLRRPPRAAAGAGRARRHAGRSASPTSGMAVVAVARGWRARSRSLGGIGNGVQWVAVMTAIQQATPIGLQARVVGLLESIGAAMPGGGFVLGGLPRCSPPACVAPPGVASRRVAAARWRRGGCWAPLASAGRERHRR